MESPDQTPEMHLDALARFLSESPSPFHAVATATRALEAAGYERVEEGRQWPSARGRRFVQRGGALIAWSNESASARDGFHLVGAHTDSPNLRIRPLPDHRGIGAAQLGVEVYGGALLNSWLDRDLGLSGRVSIEADGRVETVLVQFDEPLLRVPQLAIHLDRSITVDGLRLDPQRHLQPIWSSSPDSVPGFRTWLASRLGVDASSVLTWDIMTHDLTPPAVMGVDRSLFAAPRLDNLLSCHAAISALIDSERSHPSAVPVVCLFDHEEVGSQSSTGAAGPLLRWVLERIALTEGLSREAWLTSLPSSFCISADGAHATHPNYPDRHEPDHPVLLDHGPVLKWNANERYATDAPSAAHLELLARTNAIPTQTFVSRNDMPCGSTIGPITSTQLGIPTVDVGVAQLSMHSARELTGVLDAHRFTRLLSAFLSDDTSSR